MNSLFWNITGLDNNASEVALKKLIQRNSPNFIFITEPSMNFDNFPKSYLVRFDLKTFAFNNTNNNLPNIWCFCKNHFDLITIMTNDQHISFTIDINGTIFGFSLIYASTNYITRRQLWLKLNNVLPNIPWSFVGDFNAIVSADEYKGNHSPTKAHITDIFNWSNINHYIHLPTLGNCLIVSFVIWTC